VKKLSIFLALVILLSVFAIPMTPAIAATEGDYTYTVSNSKVTITKCVNTVSGKLEIPASLGGYPVTKLDESSFYGCKSLTEVVIPATVNSIAKTAFGSCTALEKVNIPYSVTTIMLNAFTGCNALKEVHITDMEAWVNISFGGHYSNPVFLSKALYLNGSLVTEVIVPYGVTTINNYAFTGYTALKRVVLPTSVTQINAYAFYKCTSLEDVTLSSHLKSIGGSVFSGCTSLKSITLPRSLTTVYDHAFSGCTALTDVYYTGLDTELLNVTIKSDNDALLNATYYHAHTVRGDWIIQKPATCAEEGLMYKECLVCGGHEEQSIEKLNHTFESGFVDPTCTDAGYNEFVCTACGHSYKDNYVSAKGHNFVAETVDATCTSHGYTIYSCMDCGESYTSDFVSMKEHNLNSYYVEATCTTAGYTVYYCEDCSYSFESDHTPTIGHDFMIEVIEPDCENMGYTHYTCTMCGLMYDDSYIIGEHHFNDWETIEEATCSTDGIQIRTCYDCGHEESKAITRTGHNFYENTVEPTCDSYGYTEHSCDCGEYYKDNYVSELGHIYTDWVETVPVSCSEEGVFVRSCWCGHEEVKYIEKLDHTYESVVVEPTPDAQGYTEHTCTVCGDSYQDNFVDYDALSRITLTSTRAAAGHKFKVTVSMKNNPGIMSAKIGIKYDASVMTLVSVEDLGNLGTEFHSDSLGNPYTLSWVNDTAVEDYTYSGDIAVLEFMVNKDAQAGDYSVEVFYDYDNYDIINCNLEKIEFVTENTVVAVEEVNYGDVNGDGTVNNLDRVVLTRYLADWEGYTEDIIDMFASDVNCDGVVNALDRVILTRHLADWDDYADIPYIA